MAITRLLRFKEAKIGNRAAHLKHNLFYICNPEKCGGGMWIGGNAGVTPEIIYRTMMDNKAYWGKEDGSQGFHYVLSFSPDSGVSEELAYQIAEEFCQELLGDRYFYAFAVHNDKAHMHVHITFDSVSKLDGYKFHSPKGDWEKRIQPITDRLCQKYKLPTLSYDEERKGKQYGEWKSDRDKEKARNPNHVSWYDLIRDDIDQAIAASDTYEEVLEHLRKKQYTIREGKYLSLRPFGRERAVRSSRLGKGYSIEEIKQRVYSKQVRSSFTDYPQYGNREEMFVVLRLKAKHNPRFKMTPFQRQFYRRWHNSFLRNQPDRIKPWVSNRDVVRIHRLSNAIKYMIDHDIENMEDLEETWTSLEKQKQALISARNAINTKMYRNVALHYLARYEKIKSLNPSERSKEETEDMERFLSRVERYMPYEEAVKLRDSLLNQKEEINQTLKEVRAQLKLADDLYTFYFEELPQDRAAREEKLGEELSKGKEESTSWKDRGERTRITAYKTLVSSKSDDDFYVVRLPGTEEFVKIPTEDCLMYKSGEILSAYLYDGQTYEVKNRNGELLRTETGAAIKTHFAKQKDKKQGKAR